MGYKHIVNVEAMGVCVVGDMNMTQVFQLEVVLSQRPFLLFQLVYPPGVRLTEKEVLVNLSVIYL